jgi:tRNA (guanine37-N1)-methyltransferase
MKVNLVTIFPDFFAGPLSYGVLSGAVDKGLIEVNAHDLRDYTDDNYRSVDDYPFGGGVGMIMKPEPFFLCVDEIEERSGKGHKVFFTPQGKPLTQGKVEQLSRKEHLILLCGRYKGIDERVRDALVDEEISVGDYVLSGGEAAALILIDAVARLLPGALGDEDSANTDSFAGRLLDFPHYTRPQEYRGMRVPEILLSGDHGAIEKWRREQAEQRTRERRPELIFGEENEN